MSDGARQAQWEQARTLYPSTEYRSRSWVDYFDEHPDVLTKLLGDVYRVYKTEEAKRAGSANPQGGRRKSHVNGNLEELWRILTPKFSVDPFPVACRELMGTKSTRQFAAEIGFDPFLLGRLLRGRYVVNGIVRPRVPTMDELEAIAHGADVHPAYFLEWRVRTVADILAQALEAQPHLSIVALKSLGRRPS